MPRIGNEASRETESGGAAWVPGKTPVISVLVRQRQGRSIF